MREQANAPGQPDAVTDELAAQVAPAPHAQGSDNATPHPAARYSDEVRRTLPLYELLVAQVVQVALNWHPEPKRWLDTGTGTGYCCALAHEAAPNCEFIVADPSSAMLSIARQNLPWMDASRMLQCDSANLPELEAMDVISAVQCHHYGDIEQRRAALARCRQLLASEGVLVVSENVRGETEYGHARARARWREWLVSVGRSAADAESHLQREGTQFFPIPPSRHLALLREVGFRDAELVFRSYGQAVFVARR